LNLITGSIHSKGINFLSNNFVDFLLKDKSLPADSNKKFMYLVGNKMALGHSDSDLLKKSTVPDSMDLGRSSSKKSKISRDRMESIHYDLASSDAVIIPERRLRVNSVFSEGSNARSGSEEKDFGKPIIGLTLSGPGSQNIGTKKTQKRTPT
jgi:hypothetical protein